MKDLNRLKVVLVEKKKTSKWCTNTSQPDLETIAKITRLLGVSVEDLFNKKYMESL